MKKSITLLITLMLLVALGSFVAIGLNILNGSFHHFYQKKALMQSYIFFQDIVKILRNKSSEIDSAESLSTLLALPLDLQADSDLKLSISFSSAAYGINPNHLLAKKSKKESIDPVILQLFDRILLHYNVIEKELFLALLEDSLDRDLIERYPESEIALYDRKFAQGKIENYKKFMQIVDYYAELTKDSAIYKIPWRKILSFHTDKIDLNYIAPQLLEAMLPNVEQTIIEKIASHQQIYNEWSQLPLTKESKERLQRYGVDLYVPVVKVDMDMQQNQNHQKLVFLYNVKNKKVLTFAIR